MPFQIAKSVINGLPYNYADEVEKFRQAKLAHRFTGGIAPSAPALIEHAVRRVQTEGHADDFVADYAVIDDIPVPTLAERKAALAAAIRSAEAAALAAIISPARERLMGLDLNVIDARPEAERTDADRALLAKAVAIAARKVIIQRHGITQEIAVEELTEATIDGWTPAEFPVMSGGRPRVYTTEIAERILGELMDGRTLTDVCRDAGMPAERTVRNWVADNYQGFAPRYDRARQVGFHVIADQILAIADDNSDDCRERRNENGDIETTLNPVNVTRSRLRIDARRWLLSKVLPKSYGEKLDPNAIQGVRDTLAELLREIDGRTRGLPNQPAIAALPAPQRDDTDDT